MVTVSKTTTQPAPFIPTESASHVVTTFVPLDFSLTQRTEFNGLLFAELTHQSLLTRGPFPMPVVPTLEADSIRAFRAV